MRGRRRSQVPTVPEAQAKARSQMAPMIQKTVPRQLLAGHAASLLDHLAEAEAALAALNAGETGMLRLASFATAGAELIPPALARVRAALPGLQISLRVAERDDALGLLRRGLLDLAVIEAHTIPAPEDSTLTYRPLLTDPFRIVIPRGHRLAARRLHPASQPERHVLAATRPATSNTVPVQAMITALQAEADAQGTGSAPVPPAN